MQFQVLFRDVTRDADAKFAFMASAIAATAEQPFIVKPRGGLTSGGTYEVKLRAVKADAPGDVLRATDAPLRVALARGELSAPSAHGGLSLIHI